MSTPMDLFIGIRNGSAVEVEISTIQGVWWACLGIILVIGIGLCGDAVLMEIKRLMVVWWVNDPRNRVVTVFSHYLLALYNLMR